jgi:glyoxylase-like metal-dependent hydrolase (beta-lactamase superfamily II)
MPNNSVSRRSLLRGLAGAASLSFAPSVFAPFAFGQDSGIQSTKLADRLYVLMGDGGNVAILTSPDGLFMVDGGLPEQAAAMAAAIAKVNKAPVTTLFDTHWHGDHVGSNVTMGQKGAKIVAHDNARARLSSRQTIEALNRVVDPLPPAGIPGVTFSSKGTIAFGDETIQYEPVPPAHTDGDTFLFFPKSNVMHTGDLLFNGAYPFIDYSTKGWVGGMLAAADKLLTVGDAKTQIIPGHGPMATRADLQASRDLLDLVMTRLDPMAKAGKSVDDVVAAAPLKDKDAQWGNGFMKPEAFTRIAYTSIVRHYQAT